MKRPPWLRPAAAATLFALLAGACARPATPERVVRLYFESLGRDPIRSGALVSESFHTRHGLRYSTSAQSADWDRRARSARQDAHAETRQSGPAARSRSEAEALWLATQIKETFAERAALLSISPLSAHENGDAAEVAVRVASPESPPFVQRFFLSRGGDGRWRIDHIEQEGVDERSLADAFVAAPSEALRRRLAAALGVPAD